MHTFKTTNANFICNGDFSGSVTIISNNLTCGINEDGNFEIETSDIFDFVAEAIRNKKVSQAESMTTKELLGL